MMTGDWKEARLRIDQALQLVPNEPLIIRLQGLLCALMGNRDAAIESASLRTSKLELLSALQAKYPDHLGLL